MAACGAPHHAPAISPLTLPAPSLSGSDIWPGSSLIRPYQQSVAAEGMAFKLAGAAMSTAFLSPLPPSLSFSQSLSLSHLSLFPPPPPPLCRFLSFPTPFSIAVSVPYSRYPYPVVLCWLFSMAHWCVSRVQALVDGETAVVCDAVRCLASTCGHLRKRSLLAAAGKVAPLLRHHSAAVRHSAVAFIAAAARALPAADVYTQLAVMVAGMLQQQPLLLTGALLLDVLAPAKRHRR